MTLREQLIRDAERFCEKHGISKARLATIVVNNGKFFRSLEQGGDCTTGVFERFQKIFSNDNAWSRARASDRARRLNKSRQPNNEAPFAGAP